MKEVRHCISKMRFLSEIRKEHENNIVNIKSIQFHIPYNNLQHYVDHIYDMLIHQNCSKIKKKILVIIKRVISSDRNFNMSAQKFPLAENYEMFVTLSENIAFTVVKENTFEEI